MTTRFFTITHDIAGVRVHDSAKDSSCWFGNVADLGYAYAGLRVESDAKQSKLDEIAKLVRISGPQTEDMSELKTEIQAIIAR